MGLLQGRHLNNQRVVGIIDDDVHARQPDHLVKLVATLGNHSILGHESALFNSLFLNTLRQYSSDLGQTALGYVWSNFL